MLYGVDHVVQASHTVVSLSDWRLVCLRHWVIFASALFTAPGFKLLPVRRAVYDIYTSQGAKGLFRGLPIAAAKVAPSVALSVLARDMVLGKLTFG